MNRDILDMTQTHGMIRERIANYHADILAEVKTAIADNPVVVVGMAQNPFPKKARKILDANGIEHKQEHSGTFGVRVTILLRMRIAYTGAHASPPTPGPSRIAAARYPTRQ